MLSTSLIITWFITSSAIYVCPNKLEPVVRFKGRDKNGKQDFIITPTDIFGYYSHEKVLFSVHVTACFTLRVVWNSHLVLFQASDEEINLSFPQTNVLQSTDVSDIVSISAKGGQSINFQSNISLCCFIFQYISIFVWPLLGIKCKWVNSLIFPRW